MSSPLDDDVVAVVAHSLLNSLGVISGAAETLAEHWDRIDETRRTEFLERIVTQARHVTEVLTDLVRSGRPEVVAILDEMSRGGGGEGGASTP